MKLCRLHRKIISFTLHNEGARPAFVQTHLARCPDCQRQLELEKRVAVELRRGAQVGRVPASPHLAGRIVHAVRGARFQETAAQRNAPASWGGRAALAGAFALACVAVVFSRLDRGLSPHPSRPEVVLTSSASSVSQTLSLPGQALHDWTQHLDKPFEQELERVLNDTRVALHGLARNFAFSAQSQALLSETER